jgi:hypothetical protein
LLIYLIVPEQFDSSNLEDQAVAGSGSLSSSADSDQPKGGKENSQEFSQVEAAAYQQSIDLIASLTLQLSFVSCGGSCFKWPITGSIAARRSKRFSVPLNWRQDGAERRDNRAPRTAPSAPLPSAAPLARARLSACARRRDYNVKP